MTPPADSSSGGRPGQSRRRLAAICFVDLVGYTRIASEDERAALALVGLLQEAAREAARRFGGKVVKFIGDAAMAEFPSTEAAVLAAAFLLDHFDRAADASGSTAVLRAGIHVGDVVTTPDGDLYGDGVNVAARVEGEAGPGEILVSADVARQLRQRPELHFTSVGERSLKGISDPLELFQVRVDPAGIDGWDEPGDGEGPEAAAAGAGGRTSAGTVPPGSGARVGTVGAAKGSPGAVAATNEGPETPGVGTRAGADGEPSAPGGAPDWTIRWKTGGALLAGFLVIAVLFLRPSDPVSPSPDPADLSIAVLPFADLSQDQGQGYFSDGIMEDILTQLSRIGDLRVVSRTSVMAYRASPRTVPEIAAELGVGHILQGSVRREGDQLRVSAQLVDARADRQLWGETYDRAVTDIFAIQSDIATRIAQELAARLTAAEERRIREIPTENVAAYELYLQGRELGHRYTAEENDLSIERFRRAVELDPDFAQGWAGLADAYSLKAFNYGAGAAWADSALAAAEHAVELGPESPEARKALGTAYLGRGWYQAGSAELERALDLSPSYAAAMGNLGLSRLFMGELDEAERIYRRFIALDPVGGGYRLALGNLADLHLILGSYDEAERITAELMADDPTDRAGLERDMILALFRGDEPLAREFARTLASSHPNDARAILTSGNVLLMAGEAGEARELLERGHTLAPGMNVMGRYGRVVLAVARALAGDAAGADSLARAFLEEADQALARGVEGFALGHSRAGALALLGEREEAIRVLDSVVRDGAASVRVIELDPLLDPIRDDPRFHDLVERVRERNRVMLDRVLARLEPTGPASD